MIPTTLGALVREIVQRRSSHLQAAISSTTVTSQRDLTWDEITTTYGDYATHFTARLATARAKGVTHYWRERVIRNAAANAQDEGFAWADLSEPSAVLPTKLTNTCQIFAGKITLTASEAEEARLGRLGPDLVDLLNDQLDQEYRGILKDIDKQVIEGVESETDPRTFLGLAGALGTWDGFIQTCQEDAGGDALSEDDIKAGFVKVWNATKGRYAPNALYMSMETAQAFADFTDKVRFNVDLSDADVAIKAGQRVGRYQHQYGVADLFVHPSIPYDSGTEANNVILGVCEDNVKLAFLRNFATKKLPELIDGEQAGMVGELSMEVRVEKSHFLVVNFAAA